LIEMKYFKHDEEAASLLRALNGMTVLLGEMMDTWKRVKKRSFKTDLSNSMQQALIVILQFITTLQENDAEFMIQKKEDILDALCSLPPDMKPSADCQKVRTYILSKVENFGKEEEPASAPIDGIDD